MSLGRWEEESLKRTISASGQLLVEGRVPEMFFREMVAAYGLADAVEVRSFGDVSKDTLQTYLGLFCQKAAFRERVQRLGIIRDAEAKDATHAFATVRSAIEAFNAEGPHFALPIPSQLAIATPIEQTRPQVTVFVLPDCVRSGMLETLCLEALAEQEASATSKLLPCVDEFFTCLRNQGRKPSNDFKARLAGYLLARDVIDPQLGRAAQTAGVIPWNAKAFEPLWRFIHAVAEKS